MSVTITFRTDDLTKWGTGTGVPLMAAEVDINFWNLKQAVEILQADFPAAAVGIDSFTVSGSEFFVNMTDATIQGPFTLPVFRWLFRGTWLPSTLYNVGDVVTYGAAMYYVLIQHTSATSFNPAANGGIGLSYYDLMLDLSSTTMAVGGTVGQVLTKASSADFDTEWTTPTPIPVPQTLVIAGMGYGNFSFASPPDLNPLTDRLDEVIYYPPGGSLPEDNMFQWQILDVNSFSNEVNYSVDTTGGMLIFRWSHYP